MLNLNRRWAKGFPSLCEGHGPSPSLPGLTPLPVWNPKESKEGGFMGHQWVCQLWFMRISQKPVAQLGHVEREPRVSDRRVPGAWDRKVSDEDVLTLTCADFPSLRSSHSWAWIPGEGWGVNLCSFPVGRSSHFQTCIHPRPDKDPSMWKGGAALPPCSVSPPGTLCKSECHWAWLSRTGGGEQERFWGRHLKPCVTCSALQTASGPREEDVA